MTQINILAVCDSLPSATKTTVSDRGHEFVEVESLSEARNLPSSTDIDVVLAVPENSDLQPFVREFRDVYPDPPLVLGVSDGEHQREEGLLNPGKLDFVRRRDLREHGEIVAHRLETSVAASRKQTQAQNHERSAQQLQQAANTLAAATEATGSVDLELEKKLDRILKVGTEEMGFPIGYITRIESDTQEITNAVGHTEAIHPGATDPLERTYCRKTIQDDQSLLVRNAPEDGWAEDPAYDNFGLKCYVGARIVVDGEVYGTLCFADERSREEVVGDIQGATTRALARWVGYEIERHQYESDLVGTKDRLRVLFDQAPDGIVVHDEEGTVLDVNDTIVDALGYSREELLSMQVTEFEEGFDEDFLVDAWEGMDDTLPLKVEGKHRRKDGTIYPVEVWVSRIADEDGDRYIANCRDITERRERERELERYEAFIEHSSAVVTELDDAGTIEYQSPAIERVLGYEPDELVGENAFDYVHPDDREYVIDAFTGSVDQPRTERTIEYRFKSKSGEYRWLHSIGANLLEDQAIQGIIVNSVDITDRKHHEEELERYRAYLESANDVVTLIDPDGTIKYVSPAIERVLGYSPDELVGENGFEYVHPEDIEDQRTNVEELHDQDDGEGKLEYRFRCASGEYCWIESTVRNLLDVPDVDGLLLSSRNITERKEHEQQISALHGATRELIEAESKTAVAEIAVGAATELLDFTLPSVWYPNADRSELALVANSPEHQSLLEEAGTPEPSHSRDSWIWDIFGEDDTIVRSPIPQEDLAADVPLRSTIILPLGDHGLFACAAQGVVDFSDRQIRVAEILAQNVRVALDQLDQRAALKRQKEFTDNLLDSIEDVVYVLDGTGDVHLWNEALESVTGYDSEEISSMNAVDFFTGSETERAAEAVGEALEKGSTRVELEFVTKDGETIPYEFIANTFEDPDGNPVVAGIGRDRTVHVEYEQQLERYKELVENIPAGIYRNTPGESGEFVEVNPAMIEMFDAESAEHLKNHPVSDLYGDSEKRRAFSETLNEDGVIREQEIQLQTLDGDLFWGSITAIKFDAGDRTYFDGVVQDITERIEYENRLEEQRDNLDVLNQMVRHDIRNDLQLVIAYAEMLEGEIQEDSEEYLDIILENAQNAVDLTKTARDLAEAMLRKESDVKSVSLAGILESQIDEVQTGHEEAVVTLEDTVPPLQVYGDEMLGSVFRNLLKNAILHNDKDVPKVNVNIEQEDRNVIVGVADNGPGVPDTQKEDIFGRGEKGLESEGTGIGLYLVHTLVERYDGDVWVTDNSPEGSIFKVKLKRAQ